MFDNLKVPTVALVENMSYYKCGNCETKHRIFGEGFNASIQESYGIKNAFEVPIVEDIALMSDSGTPFCVSLPDSLDIVKTYQKLAETVREEVVELRTGGKTDIKYEPMSGHIEV